MLCVAYYPDNLVRTVRISIEKAVLGYKFGRLDLNMSLGSQNLSRKSLHANECLNKRFITRFIDLAKALGVADDI